MSDVFVCYPSANEQRARENVAKWHAKGYRSLVLLNDGYNTRARLMIDGILSPPDGQPIPFYSRYYLAQNSLCRLGFPLFDARAVVCANDDIEPADKPPHEIADECYAHFGGADCWVMQPSGDPQGKDKTGKSAAQRICGSPWFGPGYVLRGYCGSGPHWVGAGHYASDVELREVAERLGILWGRDDLDQRHKHHSWGHSPVQPYQTATNKRWWKHDEACLVARRAAGFPGSDLAPA